MATVDFTTFTEVDGGGDLTVTASKIDVVTQANNVDNYVYETKSIGTGDYDWDFEHNVTANTGSYVTAFFSGVCTAINELASGFTLGAVLESNSLTPYLEDIDSSSNIDMAQAGSNLSLSTLYYSSISRVGNTLTWDIYSNSGRTTLVQSISGTIINTTQSYQYAYGSSSYNWSDTSTSTYYVQNLDYKEAVASGIQPLRRRMMMRQL